MAHDEKINGHKQKFFRQNMCKYEAKIIAKNLKIRTWRIIGRGNSRGPNNFVSM